MTIQKLLYCRRKLQLATTLDWFDRHHRHLHQCINKIIYNLSTNVFENIYKIKMFLRTHSRTARAVLVKNHKHSFGKCNNIFNNHSTYFLRVSHLHKKSYTRRLCRQRILRHLWKYIMTYTCMSQIRLLNMFAKLGLHANEYEVLVKFWKAKFQLALTKFAKKITA